MEGLSPSIFFAPGLLAQNNEHELQLELERFPATDRIGGFDLSRLAVARFQMDGHAVVERVDDRPDHRFARRSTTHCTK